MDLNITKTAKVCELLIHEGFIFNKDNDGAARYFEFDL